MSIYFVDILCKMFLHISLVESICTLKKVCGLLKMLYLANFNTLVKVAQIEYLVQVQN